MPISIPTKMSQFETLMSLSTSSYLIGLDDYAGQLSNIKISKSDAGYELSRTRWILNPPVTSSNDPRGDDGAESYGFGEYWVKSGSIWLLLTQSGSSSGGTISSSYQLSDGGSNAFDASNNVTFGKVNALLMTASVAKIYDSLIAGTEVTDNHFISGSVLISGSFHVRKGARFDSNIYTYNDINVYDTFKMFNYDAIIKDVSVGRGAGVGYQNTVLGNSALGINSIGNNNTAIGFYALSGSVSGSSNTAVGAYSLRNIYSGSFNTAVGVRSLVAELMGDQNTSVGYESTHQLESGSHNSALGYQALGYVTSGSNNTGVGYRAGLDLSVSSNNTMLGANCGHGITTGSSNTLIGANIENLDPGLSKTVIIADGTYGTGSIRYYSDENKNTGINKFGDINATLDVNGDAIISGSLVVNTGITGSLNGTSSYSLLALSASYSPPSLSSSYSLLSLTASYALNAKSNNVYNVKDYGAVGDGTSNDTDAVLLAISASQAAGIGTVYFPDGTFKITGSLSLPTNPQCDIALVGDGSNVSIIKQTANVNAIEFNMETNGANDQQYQVAIRDIGFRTSGAVSGSIYVTYGATSTSSHQNISVDISDVHIFSDSSNYWSNGIVLESAWNFRITNTMAVGKPLGKFYEGTGLEVRRMCVNGSINQSQFNFWNTGIFVNTVDYTSTGMNTEGLFIDQVYMVPVVYGIYVKGNKNFSNPPFNVLDWANRWIAGRMVLLTVNGSHIDSRNSGSALFLENVQSHYITNNLFITDNTGSVIYGSNAHEGSFIGNTLFNAGSAPSIYIGGYSGSANIITGNVFRGGSPHVLLESSSLYNKVYGNVAYNQLSISVTDSGTSNLVGSVGN